jgi:AAA15 family ATPase/GTPase
MIPSLSIKNYKNLKELEIKILGRVNLIAGKNNTGKSTLLEAVSIFVNDGDIHSLRQIIDERGELYDTQDERREFENNPQYFSSEYNNQKRLLENNKKSFSSIFNERKMPLLVEDGIKIGYLKNPDDINSLPSKYISIRFVRFIDESSSRVDNEKNVTILERKRSVIDNADPIGIAISRTGLEIKTQENQEIFPIDDFIIGKALNSRKIKNVQLVRSWNIEHDLNGSLWDNITLTSKEKFIISALKIIEPEIERIAFIKNGNSKYERSAVVKLENNNNVVPLLSMGDGINRILTIILSMVNCENGYLLIDEFENGLHYTVQEQLWKIIFELSYKLNIQVFATTHSSDSIRSFAKIMNKDEKYKDSKLIRLDFINGIIKSIEYDAEELRIAAEQDIETR